LGRPVTPVAIALGSNLGDRSAHLEYAIARLRNHLADLRVSSFHETDPVGVAAQPRFLNAAVTGSSALSAGELLDLLLTIESERGRGRPHAGAARTLDLDLILFGDEIIEEPNLRVPHPRFRDRGFVLSPLLELAPDLIDPVTGATIQELNDRAKARSCDRATGNQ
jgi:2-amino-4-hydroxy-6-hydroxymethyldihydropteridine diphosphokinase